MSYTNLPPPETHEFWRIGVHLLSYADGRFSLDQSAARVVGPPGEPDKDGIVFNLADGRVALIHRIYPNMQLAVFDSLDAARRPARRLLGAAHGGARPPHDHPPRRQRSRGRRRCAAGGDRRRAAAALPRAERARGLQHEGGPARPRDRRGEGDPRRADHVAGAPVGAAGRREQRRVRAGRDSARGRQHLHDLRRGRPGRRRRDRLDGRAARARCARPEAQPASTPPRSSRCGPRAEGRRNRRRSRGRGGRRRCRSRRGTRPRREA